MRVISKKTLKDFYELSMYKDAKESLEAWHKEAVKANWQNPNDIKQHYRHASIVGNNRVVFNIHGNKYRLIVKINYHAQVAYIRFVGTHEQYDKINASEV
ncbi:MAG: type II toxin-antitoxin system HigB family toxin [Arcobacteraceae bacterium]